MFHVDINFSYKFAIADAFVGYHDDTLASLVYQVCSVRGQTEGDQEWKNMVRLIVSVSYGLRFP